MSKHTMTDWFPVTLVLVLMLTAWLTPPSVALAKQDDDRNRQRFYGWIEVMPETLHGTWIIGGREVTTNPRTEFDMSDGPLQVGGCAKVDIREGVFHEIDSEPPKDCR